MQMMDGLAAVVAGVDNDAIAAIEPLAPRKVRRGCHQVPKQRFVLGHSLGLRGNVLFGDDNQMRRRLRVDIREADAQLIFVYAVGRDGSGDNLAKQTIVWHLETFPLIWNRI